MLLVLAAEPGSDQAVPGFHDGGGVALRRRRVLVDELRLQDRRVMGCTKRHEEAQHDGECEQLHEALGVSGVEGEKRG
jgi:hypothetical protein